MARLAPVVAAITFLMPSPRLWRQSIVAADADITSYAASWLPAPRRLPIGPGPDERGLLFTQAVPVPRFEPVLVPTGAGSVAEVQRTRTRARAGRPSGAGAGSRSRGGDPWQ